MNRLTDEQRKQLRNFLAGQGITFDPLLEEMIDHLSSDVEERMEKGLSFEEALRQAKNEIPYNQLQAIQYETMETINKRFTISRTLSFAGPRLNVCGNDL